MKRNLTREDIASRLKNHQRDGYLYIGGFMKSVTFAAGTIVLIEILSGGVGTWIRFPLWVAALLASIVTYLTWGRGILLTNSRGNLWDSILPLLMGIVEFMLFGVLSTKTFASDDSICHEIWKWWFLVVALDFLIAVGITRNREKNIEVKKDFTPSLQDLGEQLLIWIQEDGNGAIKGFWYALVVGIISLFIPEDWRWIYSIFSLPLIWVFGKAILKAEAERHKIDEAIFK